MNETLNTNIDATTINPSSEAATPRTKTMSEAALAANRANALKSTGPRTPAGKLKAASNSLKHGLYSMKNFDDFIADHDVALAVTTNFIEQFNPVTPSEVALLHQLIHMQIRFLQMEYLYGQAMRFRVEDILTKPVTFLPALLRELDRLPARIQRTMKLLRAEIAQRQAYIGHGENVEIEAIADAPKLPGRPDSEICKVIATDKGDIPLERVPIDTLKRLAGTDPNAEVDLAKQMIRDFVDRMNAKHGVKPKPPTEK
jgi:hypothetical protein